MSNVNISILKFEIDQYVVDISQYVGGDNFNSLTFINYGTSVVNVDAIILQPNQQFEIGGNTGEITTQRFFVNFGTSTSGNNVVVVRKRYINI
jgi:hypothetical protein